MVICAIEEKEEKNIIQTLVLVIMHVFMVIIIYLNDIFPVFSFLFSSMATAVSMFHTIFRAARATMAIY